MIGLFSHSLAKKRASTLAMSQPSEAPAERRRKLTPYADAPRLPAGEALGIDQILVRSTPPGEGTAAPLPRRLELEIGPGRGGFLLERLATGPDVCIVGLEIRLKWASLVDQRLHELGLADRGRVFAEDIRVALPRLADGSLSRVFVHFPDPWWKKRHAKRRLATDGVITEIARLLTDSGELFVQTDVWETADAYRQAIESHSGFLPDGDAPGSPLLAENPYGARSPRERRVISAELPVVRLRYRRGSPTDAG
jgi:tRNA (guanine-N7-)-methyltransferase